MKYTALTIGPIISSLSLARKLREMWTASFFFSHFMRLTIEEILKKEHVTTDNIILPYPHKNELANELSISNSKTTGLYPDRLILKSEKGLYQALEKATEKTISSLSSSFGIDEPYLKEYLSLRITEIDESELESNNVILEVNRLLACLELQQQYIPKDDLEFVKMLENISSKKIYNDKFGKDGFPSIIEITTRNISLSNEKLNGLLNIKDKSDSDEDKIWENILEIEKKEQTTCKDENTGFSEEQCSCYGKLKLLNKYIVIVQADGDNIGKLITQIYDTNPLLIEEFSKSLSKFALLAANAINSWGGETIYAGGDDLLFFAPAQNAGKNYFIQLIDTIDSIFKKEILENLKLKACLEALELKPSMSYGVSISYYKYPMHEAIRTAQSMLFEKAKNTVGKNAIAFSLLKHSGQNYSSILFKGTGFYGAIKVLSENDGGLALHSLLYNMNRDEHILKAVISDSKKLDAYFDNFYDEDVHALNETFINTVKQLITTAYSESNGNFKLCMEQVIAGFHLIKFLHTKKHD